MATIREELNRYRDAQENLPAIWEDIHGEVGNKIKVSSQSRTAIYKLIAFVWATLSFLLQKVWEQKEQEIQTRLDDNIAPNDRWLAQKIREFKIGHKLVIDDETGKLNFEWGGELDDFDPNEDYQIVKRVTIESANGFYVAKVAKEEDNTDTEDPSDKVPVSLTGDEVQSLNDYLDNLILGNNGEARSYDGDLIRFTLDVYYDPARDRVDIDKNVREAIELYLRSLDFRGIWYKSRMEDAIQKVDGVIDYVMSDVSFEPPAAEWPEVVAQRNYSAYSGYIKVDWSGTELRLNASAV